MSATLDVTTPNHLLVGGDPAETRVSPTLFGLFLEDLNYAVDGGLNANLVNNHSFDATYLDTRRNHFLLQAVLRRRVRRLPDRTRHWAVDGAELQVVPRDDEPGAYHARIRSSGRAVLANDGYPGRRPSMGIREGIALRFDADLRQHSSVHELTVRLVDDEGVVIAQSPVEVREVGGWQRVQAHLTSRRTALARLEIIIGGAGVVDLDEIRLFASDHWGAGDARWSQGLLRRDLVEAIRDFRPTFLRFPGGCVVEGMGVDNAYDWKSTVGPLRARRGDYNLWALNTPGGDYAQSHQIGFYEHFLLCEDLGIKPLPVVNAGMACQLRSREMVDLDSDDFDDVIRDAVDLVEWATGDPASSRWAALRAEAGHPEPFELDLIGIGNENFGAEYTARFDRIRRALQDRMPGLTFVISAGVFPAGKAFEHTWSFAERSPERLVVDEHFYKTPKWFREAVSRYDGYRRTGAKVFAGEYAAHTPGVTTSKATSLRTANTMESALSEAAFYTGLIRNSDVVVMSSYAPLFNLAEHSQWDHDFIDFTPLTVQPTLNYWAQWLFSSDLGTHVPVTRLHLPDGVYAVATTDAERTIVQLVNVSADEHAVTVDTGRNASRVHSAILTGDPGDALRLSFDAVRPVASPIRTGERDAEAGVVHVTLEPHSILRLIATGDRRR